MRFWTLSVFLLLASVMGVSAQPGTVGVPPFHRPEAAKYRALFGVGGNFGHVSDAPLSYVGAASYQLENSLYSVMLVSSSNNAQQPPRNTLVEADILYGYALDIDLARYEASPQSLHASFSAGLGFSSYTIRWRRFGRRGVIPDSAFLAQPPNTSEYSASIPLQIQTIYEPFPFAGIGVLLFANFGKLVPSYGGALVVQARY